MHDQHSNSARILSYKYRISTTEIIARALCVQRICVARYVCGIHDQAQAHITDNAIWYIYILRIRKVWGLGGEKHSVEYNYKYSVRKLRLIAVLRHSP